MNWIEILVITLGLSLDIFAAVECQGALVAKVKTKHLITICVLLTVWQTAALYLGSVLAGLLSHYELQNQSLLTGKILAAAIFIGLGIRMIRKAWDNDTMQERREEDLGYRRFLKLSAAVSIFTFLTGAAFGFLESNIVTILWMVVIVTAIVVIFGMYIGFRYGFEHKRKAYIIGGILLILGGMDVIVRYIRL